MPLVDGQFASPQSAGHLMASLERLYVLDVVSRLSMIDPFGRAVTYLRVSVTDRCDLRCVYCMAEDMSFLPKKQLLTLEEMDRICGAFIQIGRAHV